VKSSRTFPTGGAVGPDDLVDRETVLRELFIRTHDHGNSVALLGPRQTGKTSVGRALLDRVRKAGAWGIYIDCSGATDSIGDTADLIARATYDQASGSKGAFERLRELARDVPRPIFFKSDIELAVTFSGAAETPVARFDRALGLADELAVEKERRCVVVYDEFQELAALDRDIFTRIRSVLQLRMVSTAYVFMGSDVGTLHELFKSPSQMPFRLATPITLPNPAPDAWAAYIASRFRALKVQVGREEIDRLIAFTGGHPRDLMEACEHLLVSRSVSPGLAGAVDLAEARTLDGLRARFDELWRRLDKPRGTRTTASRIAHGLPVYGGGRAAATVTRTIEKLEGEGIIHRVERGTYVFTEPLFGRYVREITPAPR
jgi:hypothetical protein